MSLQAKINMVRECAGKTYDDFAQHFGYSRQNAHQKVHRRLNMKNLLEVLEFCGFKFVLYSPKGDVRIVVTNDDRLEDEK